MQKKKEQEMAEGNGCKEDSAKIYKESASTQRGAALALDASGVRRKNMFLSLICTTSLSVSSKKEKYQTPFSCKSKQTGVSSFQRIKQGLGYVCAFRRVWDQGM
jgi:hypothetical protein